MAFRIFLYVISHSPLCIPGCLQLQTMWQNYAVAAFECCSHDFWTVFQSVRFQTTVCRDRVLSMVKTLVGARGHRWPRTCRVLRDMIARKVGDFWDNVTSTHVVDLTRFELPGVDSVQFSFIDPVYVWITICNTLHKHRIPLQWDAKNLYHPDTGEEVFGAGIQYSKLLQVASARVPATSKIALFNINWDGGNTGFGSRSCTPIHVQVMNTNSSSSMVVGLVGYLPTIDVPDGYKQKDNCVQARRHVLQTCIGHVLTAIESRSTHGFRCAIGGNVMSFYPHIGVMSLDTPERVKYFGLRNKSSCGLCRRRKGRSAARKSTAHRPREIQELLNLACVPNAECRTRPAQSRRKRARDTLQRRGLDYEKRCRLTEFAKQSLVQTDPERPKLFAGLCRYERMHVYYIGFCGYLMELLVQSVPKTHYVDVHHVVQQCHQFRDPVTGATHPRLPHLLKMTHLTAERRARAIFYWAHVLGTKASVIIEPCRMHAQVAVTSLQLILIAIRGHRAYTKTEWQIIFERVGREFFRSLEFLSAYHERKRYNRRENDHRRDPTRYPEPVLFNRTARSLYVIFISPLCHFIFPSMSLFISPLCPLIFPLCHFEFPSMSFHISLYVYLHSLYAISGNQTSRTRLRLMTTHDGEV